MKNIIINHPTTTKYVESVKKQVNYYIDDHGGVAGLRYYKNIDRKENYLVKAMLKDEIFEPSYPEKTAVWEYVSTAYMEIELN